MFFRPKVVKSEHRKYKEKANKEFYDEIKRKDKERKADRITYLEIISDNLMLPPDMIAGAPIITINGRNSVCIENHKRILEYSETKIRVQTKLSGLCIEGKNLKIAYCTQEEIKITGMIYSVYYIQGSKSEST